MRLPPASLWLLLWLLASLCSQAAEARILKVLPHYLDLEGQHSKSPSLFERDAYQAFLRDNPSKRSGLRFDILWKAKPVNPNHLRLQIELRTSGAAEPIVVEKAVRPARLFSRWSSLILEGEDYTGMGKLVAWRTSLWRGDQLLAEQKSFLW